MKLYDSLRKRLGRQRSPLERLAGLSAGPGGAESAGRLDDPVEAVRSCRDRSAAIRSYRSEAIFRVASQAPGVDGPMRYVVEAVRPDRFHVWQSAWMEGREVFDEWITIGEEHYDNVGKWGKALMPDRQKLNKELAFEAFLRALDSVGSHECLAYKLDTRSFLRLDADLVPPLLAQDRDPAAASMTLWIDGESWLPAKVQASAVFEEEGTSVRLELDQVFYDFDTEISISPPRVELSAEAEHMDE